MAAPKKGRVQNELGNPPSLAALITNDPGMKPGEGTTNPTATASIITLKQLTELSIVYNIFRPQIEQLKATFAQTNEIEEGIRNEQGCLIRPRDMEAVLIFWEAFAASLSACLPPWPERDLSNQPNDAALKAA